jgi:hypothetical protein
MAHQQPAEASGGQAMAATVTVTVTVRLHQRRKIVAWHWRGDKEDEGNIRGSMSTVARTTVLLWQ